METSIESKINMPVELQEVQPDFCGGVVTESNSGCKPIKVPANGCVYVRSSKLEEKKLSDKVSVYKIIINKVDTNFAIGSGDLKKNGRIQLMKYEHGELTIVYYPVSECDIWKLRIFRRLRGNDYPRGPGKIVVFRPKSPHNNHVTSTLGVAVEAGAHRTE